MMLIVRSTRSEQHRSTVPLEVMNIVLALSELDADHLVDPEHLIKNIFPVPTGDYFTLISCLYYIKNAGRYLDVKEAVQRRIVDLVERADLLRDSQPAHLILDVLSCPYLPKVFRTDLLLKIAPKIGILVRSKSAAVALVDEIQHRPWFVRWEKVDLLNMVRKKELSVVY